MRVRVLANVQIYDDTDQRHSLLALNATRIEEVIDGFERCTSGKLSIDADGTEALEFGDIDSPQGVFLLLDGDADLALNGSADLIEVRRSSDTAGVKARFLFEGTVSSLSITNVSSTATLTGIFAFWGDAAA